MTAGGSASIVIQARARSNRALMLVPATLLLAGAGEMPLSGMPPAIDRMLKVVRARGTVDRPTAEQMVGVPLTPTDSGRYFAGFAGNRHAGKLHLAADLRQPIPGSGAEAGALLVVRVEGMCIGRSQLESRYGTLKLVQVPHGHSLDEEASWQRDEPWGRVSFGFAERRPECLSSIAFTTDRA